MPRIVPSQICQYIERVYPTVINQTDNERRQLFSERAGSLGGLMRLLKELPDELIIMSENQFVEFIAAKECIQHVLRIWRNRGATEPLVRVPELGNLNPVTLIHRALQGCPDEPVPMSEEEISFIDDPNYRSSLVRDLRAVDRALSNGEWKAATVLAGSIIEAFLLWSISRLDKKSRNEAITRATNELDLSKQPDTNLERWTLEEYAKVSHAAELISEDTLTQILLAKNFRNLIHPGRERRLGIQCDRGTALAATAAIQFVQRDLQT